MALNYTTGAKKKTSYQYVDADGGRTAITSPYVTGKASAGRQYAAAKQGTLADYYKNKAVNNAYTGIWGDDIVGIPTENDTYSPSYTKLSEAISRGESQTTGSGSGGSSGSAYNGNAPYIEQLNALYDKIMNRGSFNYDLNGDLLYRQMADQYTQLGQQAMRDTMGQAAALTGGYGNSYATQAGNQAYQQYLTALNQQIPDLYDRAYNAYQDDMDWLLQQYQLAAAHPEYLSALTPTTGGGTTTSEASTGTSAADIMALINANSGKTTSTSKTGKENTENTLNNELAKWYYKLLTGA